MAAGLASGDATVVTALLFWSAIVMPSAGIKRKAELLDSTAFKSGVLFTTAGPAVLGEAEAGVLVLAGESDDWMGLDVTRRVADSPFPAEALPAAAVVKRS